VPGCGSASATASSISRGTSYIGIHIPPHAAHAAAPFRRLSRLSFSHFGHFNGIAGEYHWHSS
jgi:hypothetical protein